VDCCGAARLARLLLNCRLGRRAAGLLRQGACLSAQWELIRDLRRTPASLDSSRRSVEPRSAASSSGAVAHADLQEQVPASLNCPSQFSPTSAPNVHRGRLPAWRPGRVLLPRDWRCTMTLRSKRPPLGQGSSDGEADAVVAANLLHGQHGKWSAMNSREIYQQARTAGFVYQAVLRGELTRRLGVI